MMRGPDRVLRDYRRDTHLLRPPQSPPGPPGPPGPVRSQIPACWKRDLIEFLHPPLFSFFPFSFFFFLFFSLFFFLNFFLLFFFTLLLSLLPYIFGIFPFPIPFLLILGVSFAG